MFSKKILDLAAECEKKLRNEFDEYEAVSAYNTERVLKVFNTLQLAERHFNPTSGYGYNDDGRELADKAYSMLFGTESGFVRHSIASGTHALGIGLFALLRPNDTMLSVTGKPYDTLDGVIGIGDAAEDGCLADFGIKYKQIELIDGKSFDFNSIKSELEANPSVKIVYAQRSKGYLNRASLTRAQIDELYDFVKAIKPNVFVVIDNCYGEFCEKKEPKGDLLIGSLIKNPGGGIAESGAYLVGSQKAIDLAAARLTVPGIGLECGASLGQTKNIIKGLFFAPHAVCQAKKTAAFASMLFDSLGYEVNPKPGEYRTDIIQTVSMGSAEGVCAFCRGIQKGSPVDSFVTPEPWDMPGYTSPVVMAAGAFTQGSSLELSADAPIRPPYTVFMQGGLTYESGRYGIMLAAQECENNK